MYGTVCYGYQHFGKHFLLTFEISRKQMNEHVEMLVTLDGWLEVIALENQTFSQNTTSYPVAFWKSFKRFWVGKSLLISSLVYLYEVPDMQIVIPQPLKLHPNHLSCLRDNGYTTDIPILSSPKRTKVQCFTRQWARKKLAHFFR